MRRFEKEKKLEVGDTIVSVCNGQQVFSEATPDNIDDLLRGSSSMTVQTEVTIRVRKSRGMIEYDEQAFQQLEKSQESEEIGQEIEVKMERGGAGAYVDVKNCHDCMSCCVL